MKNSTICYQPSAIYRRGFTLIELLVVIVIIGILSAFLIANFIGIKERARDAQRKSDLRNIQSALEIYRSDMGTYPSEGSFSCLTPGTPLSDGDTIYMQTIPCDPLGAEYSYNFLLGSYTLIACLENAKDFQKDISSNESACPPASNTYSFTLRNP